MKDLILRGKYYLIVSIIFLALIGISANKAREAVKTKFLEINQWDDTPNLKDPLRLMDREVNPEGFELLKEKAFLDAQLELSNSDSITLIIDLKDSLAVLQIKGVAIYTSKITYYSYSALFNDISVQAYYNIFGKPISISNQNATIAKEPIVIKKAPKDTIEAAQPEVIPDSVVNQSAVLKFTLNNDILLVITNHEEEKGSFIERRLTWSFEFIKQLIEFKKVVYQPTIKLVIQNEDIVVIYRALPWKAKIALKF